MKSIHLIEPVCGSVVSQKNPYQKAFQASVTADGDGPVFDWSDLVSSSFDRTFPKHIRCRWVVSGVPGPYTLELSEDPEFRTVVLVRRARRSVLHLQNLKTGSIYFWRVSAGKFRSETFSFRTAEEAPRWIKAEKVSNIRDLGAWKTADGRRIRQGMIFRGGEMNSHMTLLPHGRKVLRDFLKIRTNLDIRMPNEIRAGVGGGSPALPWAVPDMIPENAFSSPIGGGSSFVNIPIRPYREAMTPDGREAYTKVFRLLLDEGVYPVYFHCWGGADRTGTLALFLCGALGVPERDLILDYELTTLSIWGERRISAKWFREFRQELDRQFGAGTPLDQCSVLYWKSCGITDGELERFRALMLE